jgi:hypothetical protein
MVGAPINIILDELWKDAQGSFDLGDVKIEYDVRPNMTKEEWKKQWTEQVFGKQDDFVQCPNGKILMPNLGII